MVSYERNRYKINNTLMCFRVKIVRLLFLKVERTI